MAVPIARKPRVLLDLLAFDPRDGGFATVVAGMLRSCEEIAECDFLLLFHRRHRDLFASRPFEQVAVWFPYKLRFVASLFLAPWYCRKKSVDAIHCEISALPRGVSVSGSVTVHDLYILENADAGPRSLVGRMMKFYWRHIHFGSLRRALIVKSVSQATTTALERYGVSTKAVTNVYPFVEGGEKRRQERSWPGDPEPVRLLFLGSIVPRRNLPFLLRALPDFHRDWRLDIVGSPWWGMRDIEQVLCDSRVTFHGYVSDAERDRFMAESHILISPSLCEGFGYPIAEAMARGMLVMTSDIDIFREYVPERLRFSLDAPTNLASCFNRLDASTYEELCKLCRDSVARFNYPATREGYRQLFRQLVGLPNSDEHDGLVGNGDTVQRIDAS